MMARRSRWSGRIFCDACWLNTGHFLSQTNARRMSNDHVYCELSQQASNTSSQIRREGRPHLHWCHLHIMSKSARDHTRTSLSGRDLIPYEYCSHIVSLPASGSSWPCCEIHWAIFHKPSIESKEGLAAPGSTSEVPA